MPTSTLFNTPYVVTSRYVILEGEHSFFFFVTSYAKVYCRNSNVYIVNKGFPITLSFNIKYTDFFPPECAEIGRNMLGSPGVAINDGSIPSISIIVCTKSFTKVAV